MAWLHRNAPSDYQRIRPAATSAQVRQLRRALPAPIPPDLLRWLRTNNGIGIRSDLLPGLERPIGVNEIIEAYRIQRQLGRTHGEPWPTRFFPVFQAVTGDFTYEDARPGRHLGCLHAYFIEDGFPSSFEATGLADFFGRLFDSLSRGRYPGRWRLVVHRGSVDWRR